MRTQTPYLLFRFVFPGPLIRVLFHPIVEDLRLLPARGPFIVASNHLSWLDGFLVQMAVRRPMAFLARQECFPAAGPHSRMLRRLGRRVGVIPVDRSGGAAAAAVLDEAAAILRSGGVVTIFPEGTWSVDGAVHRGRTGVGRLALRTGAPVVPVAMMNTDQIHPPTRLLPRLKRARIRVGTPICVPCPAEDSLNLEAVRDHTDLIMRSLADLTGRSYVDRYLLIPGNSK